jgi:hypothetical protein
LKNDEHKNATMLSRKKAQGRVRKAKNAKLALLKGSLSLAIANLNHMMNDPFCNHLLPLETDLTFDHFLHITESKHMTMEFRSFNASCQGLY